MRLIPDAAMANLAGWIAAGAVTPFEHVGTGLEPSPDVMRMLFDRSHRDKLILKV